MTTTVKKKSISGTLKFWTKSLPCNYQYILVWEKYLRIFLSVDNYFQIFFLWRKLVQLFFNPCTVLVDECGAPTRKALLKWSTLNGSIIHCKFFCNTVVAEN